MNIRELLFDEAVDQVALVEDCGSNDLSFAKPGGEAADYEAMASKRGALCGGTLTHRKFIGDVENTISLGTAGVFTARNTFREGVPFYRQYDDNGILSIYITYHFLTELRRQLAGEVAESRFSDVEELFYTEYKAWADGGTIEGELELALVALDTWLVDEITGTLHPELNREYSATHKWVKLGTRE